MPMLILAVERNDPKHGLEHQLRETIKRRTTEIKVEIQLSMSSENENGIWNSVFQSCRKMKNKNRSLNFVFGNRRKTENANGISNFVFKCRRKTVGTRVHALTPLLVFVRVQVCFKFFFINCYISFLPARVAPADSVKRFCASGWFVRMENKNCTSRTNSHV